MNNQYINKNRKSKVDKMTKSEYLEHVSEIFDMDLDDVIDLYREAKKEQKR